MNRARHGELITAGADSTACTTCPAIEWDTDCPDCFGTLEVFAN